jgi:hypothetical protein
MDTTATLKVQSAGAENVLPPFQFQPLDSRLVALLQRGGLPTPARQLQNSDAFPLIPAIAFEAIRAVS